MCSRGLESWGEAEDKVGNGSTDLIERDGKINIYPDSS